MRTVGGKKKLIRWWIISFRESLCTDARGRGLVVTCNGYGKEKLQRLLQLLWLLLDAEPFSVAWSPPIFLSHDIDVFRSK